MTHFAVVAPPLSSHVAALQALAAELLDRGHRVSWLGPADLARRITDPRIGFVATESEPRGRPGTGGAADFEQRAARPDGLFGLLRLVDEMARTTTRLCEAGRPLLERIGAEALIADQMEAAGGLLAEALGLPFASVACALPINREPRVPLPVMPWGYAASAEALQRNAISTRVYDRLMRAHALAIEAQCRRWKLPARQRLDECLSPHLQISQTPAVFDFPRTALPAGFHAVGPLRPRAGGATAVRPARRHEAVDSAVGRNGAANSAAQAPRRSGPPSRSPPSAVPPWLEPAPGVPFVFVSLGTLQGGRFGLLRRIVRACRTVGVQSLVAHCGGLDARRAATLEAEGATWVTDFADQRAVLARADAVVTHAGLNTVLDAATAGTPALALPIAFDQPGVAARLVHAGMGLRMSYRWSSSGSIAGTLERLLAGPAFAARAAALGAETRHAGGVARAADLIEAEMAPRSACLEPGRRVPSSPAPRLS